MVEDMQMDDLTHVALRNIKTNSFLRARIAAASQNLAPATDIGKCAWQTSNAR